MMNPARYLLPLALPALLLTTLAGCASNQPRYQFAPEVSQLRLNALVSSAMVRTVSLPAYGAAEEIAVEDATGAVRAAEGLWADDPARAMTLTLARHLDTILNATVAAEPWPLEGLPDVSVDIRVERILTGADGQFHLSGAYYIAGEAQSFRRNGTQFAIAVPVAGSGAPAIATAQSAALRDLAERIARTLGR